MSTEIYQAHDAFFRSSLSHVSVAKDFLKAHLAPGLVQKIDWNTLQLTNKSFVTKELAQLHSDLVFSCQLDGKKAYIYMLIEHQSTPDPLLPFRVLQYDVSLMDMHLKQGHKKLPVIVNLCLYSGQQSPYPHSVDLFDCFESPLMAKRELFAPLHLIDLTVLSEEELSKHGQADLVELLLKHSQARTFLDWIKANPELVRRLLERLYGTSGIVYILGTEKEHSAQKIIEAIVDLAPDKKQKIMTAAQQLRQEGIQKGIQKGIQTRNVEIAKTMLADRTPIDQVRKWTGLDIACLQALLKELSSK